MRYTLPLHLLAGSANEATSFQIRQRSSVTRTSYRAINISRQTSFQLRSSFTDLSGRDDVVDDKIQILLDSLDALKSTPPAPEPAEPTNDPLDDMVEKMATPLKFLTGRIDKEAGGDNGFDSTADAAVENASNETPKRSTDDATSSSTSTITNLQAGEPATKATITSVPSLTDSSPPVVIEKPSTQAVVPEKVTSMAEEKLSVEQSRAQSVSPERVTTTAEEKPTIAAGSSTEELNTSPKAEQISESETADVEEKTSDVFGLFRKKSDGAQHMDQITETAKADPSSTLAKSTVDTTEQEETSLAATAQQSIESNLKSFIQAIPSTPSLPSFTPPDLGNVDFGIVGGVVIIVTLYLSLAAYLKGVDKDEGYAEWDQYKRKESKENVKPQGTGVDTALNAAVGAIKDAEKSEVKNQWFEQPTPYGLVNKDTNPFAAAAAAKAIAPKPVTKAGVSPPVEFNVGSSKEAKPITTLPPPEPVPKPQPSEEEIVAAQLERLDNIERMVNKSTTASAAINVEKIEQYCEPKKVNPECSESISNYLGNLSEQLVEKDTQKAAATRIISYLDSLSSAPEQKPAFSGPAPAKSQIVKAPSETSAAFSSYLDALSNGDVPDPPSAQAVAGYLDVLSAEAATASASSQRLGNRINEVENRLNRLETSVASLPDNIASRLIEWQMRQDQKVNDEIEKIKLYLMSEKSANLNGME